MKNYSKIENPGILKISKRILIILWFRTSQIIWLKFNDSDTSELSIKLVKF